MAERLILDDAQYGLLRSLHACGGAARPVHKADLLAHVQGAGRLTPERAMQALADLHDFGIVLLNEFQEVFLAPRVFLHPEEASAFRGSIRSEDGDFHLVLPQPEGPC